MALEFDRDGDLLLLLNRPSKSDNNTQSAPEADVPGDVAIESALDENKEDEDKVRKLRQLKTTPRPSICLSRRKP